MGYKFGQNLKFVEVEIGESVYEVEITDKTARTLQDFGAEALSYQGREKFDFDEAEEFVIDFFHAILGEEQANQLMDEIPERFKNVFEYLFIASHISDSVTIGLKKATTQSKPNPNPTPRYKSKRR